MLPEGKASGAPRSTTAPWGMFGGLGEHFDHDDDGRVLVTFGRQGPGNKTASDAWDHPAILHNVQFSCSVVANSLQSHGLQHARLP